MQELPTGFRAEQTDDPKIAEMAALYEETLQPFQDGAVITGKVLTIRGNEVVVDIGYKSEGVVLANEFEDIAQVQPGGEYQFLLVEIENDDGMVVLSKEKADEKLHWESFLERCAEGSMVEGLVRGRVRGGMLVDVEGVEAFLPGSQIDLMPVRDVDSLIGQTMTFKVLKISNERRNIIVSRRVVIEEEMEGKKHELLATLQEGQLRCGRVKNITDFGVFVDLDGMDGLLHITDMSWGRIKHPSELVQVGQELNVIILGIDLDRERVSLGLKQTQPNPWEEVAQKYPSDSRLRGKVVNLAPYGAFVEIEPGIEGLVHVSEFSWTKRVARASDVLSVGDEVDVVVLNVNVDDQRIALGIRQTEANPWDTVQERYPVGARVSGKVRNFTTYGAFVELEDGIDGMVHVSDMSWTRKINHPNEMLRKGEEVEAVVLEVDPSNQRISLGIKQALDDPWNSIQSRYKVGQVVKGQVSKVASFGAFVEIEEGIDGLVHISQIRDEHVDKVKDALRVGQEVEARIIKIDSSERRVGLSIKALEMDETALDSLTQEAATVDLRPGEEMVGLASAFDQAFSQGVEEWRPGQKAAEDAGSAAQPAPQAGPDADAADAAAVTPAPKAPAKSAGRKPANKKSAGNESEPEPEAAAPAEPPDTTPGPAVSPDADAPGGTKKAVAEKTDPEPEAAAQPEPSDTTPDPAVSPDADAPGGTKKAVAEKTEAEPEAAAQPEPPDAESGSDASSDGATPAGPAAG